MLTICQDWTLIDPTLIVNWFPVGDTSAEAPATTLFKAISNCCPVRTAKVIASNSACPWAISKPIPVIDTSASALIEAELIAIDSCCPTISASGEGSTIPSSTVNPIPAGDAIVTGSASTVPKLAVRPIPVTGANAQKPEAPQTSEPQVSLPQPSSLYASTVRSEERR